MSLNNIDKSKLVLANDIEKKIQDQPLETIEIGYYKDSWNRFKKNKASVVAFYILMVVFFFVAFGPYMKTYTLPSTSVTDAGRLAYLPPKIPGLEKLGIFDGRKTIKHGKNLLTYIYHDEVFGEGVIISGFPDELKEDPNHPDYAEISTLTVEVDYYKYVNYIKSYLPETYFADKALYDSGQTTTDPLTPVTRILTEAKFQEYLEKNYIIDVIRVRQTEDVNNPGTFFNQYEVRMNQFLLSLDQTPEDTYFWFGTTGEGKDLFTEIWKGARVSLLMAIAVLIVNTTVGLTLGAVVGYYGGVIDLIFDRVVEILSSIPFLSVITLLTIRFGSALWVIVLAFTATGWISSYYTGRMQFYRFKNREYVLAARTLNASDGRIMLKHIFPNTLGYIVTGYALAIPSFIFSEASYSFLGIINYAKTTSVGMLLNRGQQLMGTDPHLLIFPSLYIAILMITFNLFGNGLRDAFNPSLRGVE